MVWETITWKERYFHIRSIRGLPNEPRILMVLHHVGCGSVTALSSAKKVPEILLKSLTYKWLYILKGILYVDRILPLPFRAVLFFLNSFWTFSRPQTRKFSVLRACIFGQYLHFDSWSWNMRTAAGRSSPRFKY